MLFSSGIDQHPHTNIVKFNFNPPLIVGYN